jgi:hypothetical protein
MSTQTTDPSSKKEEVAPKRNQAIHEEVERLLKAGFIREVDYPQWLANVVLVKKSSGKWRMCVDFNDLNKACPKDSFPLPHMDVLINSTSGPGAEPGGREGAHAPPQPPKFFLSPCKFLLDILVAHPQPLVKGHLH